MIDIITHKPKYAMRHSVTTLALLVTILSSNLLLAQPTSIKLKSNEELPTVSVEVVKERDIWFNKKIYKTEALIQYKYLKKQAEVIQIKIKSIKDDLYTNSNGDISNHYTDDVIKQKLDEITELNEELDKINKEKHELYIKYSEDFLQYRNFNVLDFGPNRSKAFFNIVYDRDGRVFRPLTNAGVNFGNNTASIYSEIVSGNLGLLKVSFGTMVASNNNDDSTKGKEQEAFQRLVTFGGNTILNIEYPLAYIHSSNNQYNFISRLVGKGAADFPEFGTTTDEFAGSINCGINIYADASLSNNQLRFFLDYSANYYYCSETFKENLGILDTQFTLSQLSVGIVFMQNFKASVILFTNSSEKNLENKRVIVGGQVVR